jgi:hypothetical protein
MRGSVFDDDKAEIETLLSKGYTQGEVFDILGKKYPDRYAYITFYNFVYFVRSRNLAQKNKKQQCSRTCDTCENCGKIEPFFTGHDRKEIKYCKLNNRQINPKTDCPTWCEMEMKCNGG